MLHIIVTPTYDNQGTVIRSIDILNLKEYNYSYNEGRLLRAVECTITLDEYENVTSRATVNEIRYNYDADGNMIGKQVIFAKGAGNLKFRKEEAREALDEMAKWLTEGSPDWCKAQYAALAGTWELLYGSPEAALEHYLWQKNHILEYQGPCYSYYNTLGQIGQVLRRLKRLEEALENYKEILIFARENGHTALHQRVCCNVSGIYLDMHKPEDALAYLHDAVEEGRQIGGLPLGEALWSTAQAHRQLRDTAQEAACLQEAPPLLEEAYGTEHPKVRSTHQRLAELA